jgi:hypothetical protein
MKNILLTYFESVYTLEAFFAEINLKLTDKADQEKLKRCTRSLSSVFIAFDFKLTGPFKSYVDKRFTYEQLLYLCFIKISESAGLHEKFFENHMLKTTLSHPGAKNIKANMSLPPHELEKRLASTENLSICYFLSRHNGQNAADGAHWRELFDVIGCSIMKYIIIYSYMFRKVSNNKNVYVQISGPKFNLMYKGLIQRKLESDEAMIKQKIKQSVLDRRTRRFNQPPVIDEVARPPPPGVKVAHKPVMLNTAFEAKEEAIKSEILKLKTVEFQLDKLGHQKLNKTSILYDRYLGSCVSNRFVYSNRALEPGESTSQLIMSKFIFDKIDLTLYPTVGQISEMQAILSQTLTRFVKMHRACPFRVFLHCFCVRTKDKPEVAEPLERNSATKRKRNGEEAKQATDNDKNKYF